MDELEERRARPRGIQVVVQGSAEIRFEFGGQRREGACPVPRPPSLVPRESLAELADAPDPGARACERVVREIERLAVMGLPEQEPYGRRVHALVAQIAGGEKVVEPLRHFGPAHVQELAVYPDAGERLAGGRFGLGDLVLVMRENQVDAAGVDVERLAAAALPDLLERHRRALQMPARPAASERRV